MILKFIKFILSCIFIILTLITLLSLFVKFILLNQTFYNYSLNQNAFYENLARGLKSLSRDYLIDAYSKSSGTDFNNMTLGERQQIESQIENYTAFINKDSAQTVVEGNINNLISYLNNKKDNLYIYLPIQSIGLDEQLSAPLKDYFTNDQLSVKSLLEKNKASESDIKVYENLKYTSQYTGYFLIFSFALFLLILFLFTLFGKKGKKYESMGLLLTIDGVLVLVISWVLFTAQRIFSEGIAYKTQTFDILAGVLVPLFLKPLIILFVIFGILLLFLGILFFNKKSEKQLESKAKLR